MLVSNEEAIASRSLLPLLKEASVEFATLLFLLLSDNQETFYLHSCVSGTYHCKEMTYSALAFSFLLLKLFQVTSLLMYSN